MSRRPACSLCTPSYNSSGFLPGPEDDEEAAALEREFEAIRAQDDAVITDRGDRAAKDHAKGAAVKNQKARWEHMLEMRILLQRCLQVHPLPYLPTLQAATYQTCAAHKGWLGLLAAYWL